MSVNNHWQENDNARRGAILRFSFNYYNAYVLPLLFKGLCIDRRDQLKKFAGSCAT